MTAITLAEADDDLEQAFDYYQQRRGLGMELIEEFRTGVELILEYPGGWRALDDVYRQYRLHRFPYGIIYRVDHSAGQIIIVAIMHLSRRPGFWRERRI